MNAYLFSLDAPYNFEIQTGNAHFLKTPLQSLTNPFIYTYNTAKGNIQLDLSFKFQNH